MSIRMIISGTYVCARRSDGHQVLPSSLTYRIGFRTLQRIFDGHGSVLGSQMADESSRYDVLNKSDFPKPQRTRRIAVANQKGGVGKTTSTVNTAAALANKGAQVLVIDMDCAGQCLYGVGCISCIGQSPRSMTLSRGYRFWAMLSRSVLIFPHLMLCLHYSIQWCSVGKLVYLPSLKTRC